MQTRSRIRSASDTNSWEVIENTVRWDPLHTAVVICDMWDRHWCAGATRRVAEMAPRMNALVQTARSNGVFVIHCPSDTMKFYQDTPQRQLARGAPEVTARVPLQRWCALDKSKEAPLPIDDSDGGCDDWPQCRTYTAWSRQIPTIEVQENDAVTDSAEAYYLMRQRGITNVLVMGVHLNMCVLGRPFSIRQMVNQGQNVLLVRDLTDTMYNSRRRPYVPHCVGNDLMVEHVERYWCPTVSSAALLGGQPLRFREDQRPHVVFMIGEDEYDLKTTLPEFARSELVWRGLKCTFAHASARDKNDFPGLEALKDADLVVIGVRRRTPAAAQMDALRQHLEGAKPLVGVRTASHAFGAKPPDSGHQSWDRFDAEILGASYQGHYNNKPPEAPATIVLSIPGAVSHPILTAVPTNELRVTSHLYKYRDLAQTVSVLMEGRRESGNEIEPLTWINTNQNRRVFYTSLGNPDDFKLPAFRRLLLNGILWTLEQPIPPAVAGD